MTELLPCPCCGADKPYGTVTPEIGIPSGDSGYRMTIKCRECGCIITRWALKKAWAIESAKSAWSRRAESDRLRADNHTLRNELCLKCGRYGDSHNGSCDGCRWKKG